MTNEEAIGLIKPIMFMMKNPQGEVWSDAYYALEMAIKALEQELIEVEAAKLQEAYNKGFADGHVAKNATTEQFGNAEELGTPKKNLAVEAQEPCKGCCNGNQIEKAKLCQRSYLTGMEHKQEPKTGHWIMLPIMAHECSNCGIRKDYELEWNYCPNCGCRMEK